jgi:hypothetical protein
MTKFSINMAFDDHLRKIDARGIYPVREGHAFG